MATVVNFIDTTLRAAAERTVNLPTADIQLLPSAPLFKVGADGTITPDSITFTATLVDLDAALTFNAVGAPLTNVTASSVTVVGADMTGTSVTVIASATVNGRTYTKPCTITKVQDGVVGGRGPAGQRGTVDISAGTAGTAWSDAEATRAIADTGYGVPQMLDVVTLYNQAAGFANTRYWNGSAWNPVSQVINGSLLVKESVAADKIDARGLSIKDAQGNVILAAGSALPAAYAAPGTKNSEIAAAIAGQCINRDPNFETASSWYLYLNRGGATNFAFQTNAPGAASRTCIYPENTQGTGNAEVWLLDDAVYPIDPNRMYEESANIFTDGGNNRGFYLAMCFYDSGGNIIYTNWGGGWSGYPVAGVVPEGGKFTRYAGRFGAGTGKPIPSNATQCRVGIILNYGASGASGLRMAAQGLRLVDVTDVAKASTTADWVGVSGPGKPSDNATSDLVLVGYNYVTVTGNRAVKVGGGADWDSQFQSREGFSGGAYATARVEVPGLMMFGLSTVPDQNASYASIDFAIYPYTDGNLYAYASGNGLGGIGTYSAGDTLGVIYDGTNVYWTRNGTVLYTRAVASPITVPLYIDSSFATPGATLSNIRFGPLTSNNWASIGGSGKPQNNATVGAPAGTYVGEYPAENVALGAVQGSSAYAALPGVNAAISSKLQKDSNDTITGSISLQATYALLVGTANDGIFYGSSGIYGRKGGYTTFSIGADGTATFAGTLLAATGSFGRVTIAPGGSVSTSNYAGWQWPADGSTGFYLGPEGLLLGNINTGQWFLVNEKGEIDAPGFKFQFGQLTLTSPILINPKSQTTFAVSLAALNLNGQANTFTYQNYGRAPTISNGTAGSYLWSFSLESGDIQLISDPASSSATLRARGQNISCAGYLTVTVKSTDGVFASTTCRISINFGAV